MAKPPRKPSKPRTAAKKAAPPQRKKAQAAPEQTAMTLGEPSAPYIEAERRRRQKAATVPETPPPSVTESPSLTGPIFPGTSVNLLGVAAGAPGPTFPIEWRSETQELVRLLGDLRQAIEDAEPALRLIEEARRWASERRGIGHNQPPEQIENIPSADEIVTEATVAADALLEEFSSDQPHRSAIRLAIRVLGRVAGWIGSIGEWAGKKADVFLDDFLKHFAKPAAKVSAAALAVKLLGLQADMSSIINLIEHFR